MKFEKEFKEFAKFCNAAGASASLTQGSGGNVSVKIDKEHMLIKASGFCMRHVSCESGIALVSIQALQKILFNSNLTEEKLKQGIKEASLAVNGKITLPSIETGLHALLGTAVIHQHSIYANFINCCQDGKYLAKKLFPNSLFIDFYMPGAELCLAIKSKMAELKNKKSGIIFLKNHGLVVYEESINKALALSANVNAKIKKYFSLPPLSYEDVKTAVNANCFIKNASKNLINLSSSGKFLNLDQMLYCPDINCINNSIGNKEILSALVWLIDNYKERGLMPAFLNDNI